MEKLEEAIKVAKSAAKIIEDNVGDVLNAEKSEGLKPGWICPKCGSDKTSAFQNYIQREGDMIYCQKVCLKCGNRFRTTEVVVSEE